MDAQDMISQIDTIYDRFKIPPNLREHMRRVAAVGKYIIAHWKGPALAEEMLIAALLTHDLGNIAKYDFETEFNDAVFDHDKEEIAHWKSIKEEIVAKYGENDHEVTERMMQELAAPKRILEIHAAISFMNNEKTLDTTDWVIKIATYADQRVGPHGVVTLQGRFDDFEERYKHKMPRGLSRETITNLQNAMFAVEKELEKQMDVSADEITDAAISKDLLAE